MQPVDHELAAEVEQALCSLDIGVALHDARPGEPCTVQLNDDGLRAVALGWIPAPLNEATSLADALGFRFVWIVCVAPGQPIDMAPWLHEFANVELHRSEHMTPGRVAWWRVVQAPGSTEWTPDPTSRGERAL